MHLPCATHTLAPRGALSAQARHGACGVQTQPPPRTRLQGYLTCKRQSPSRTLQQNHLGSYGGPLGEGSFFRARYPCTNELWGCISL